MDNMEVVAREVRKVPKLERNPVMNVVPKEKSNFTFKTVERSKSILEQNRQRIMDESVENKYKPLFS